jgi:hypothetical protein
VDDVGVDLVHQRGRGGERLPRHADLEALVQVVLVRAHAVDDDAVADLARGGPGG